jgi:hypothetical protein
MCSICSICLLYLPLFKGIIIMPDQKLSKVLSAMDSIIMDDSIDSKLIAAFSICDGDELCATVHTAPNTWLGHAILIRDQVKVDKFADLQIIAHGGQ